MAFYIFICALIGLVVGSFLNVVINRLKLNQAFTGGRSHCPHCKHIISPQDLIPVFSFIFLQGRCRYCRKKISWQYPAVEAVTALSYVLAGIKFQDSFLDLFFVWAILGFLIVIAVYDLKHFLILDRVVYPGLAVAIIYAIAIDVTQGCGLPIQCVTISGLLGALVISGFFYLQYMLSSGRWIGFGDVKYGLLLGMISGFLPSFLTLFLAYISGAIIGVMLIAMGKKHLASKMPFGTFLSFAAVITILYGDLIIKTYLGLIGLETL